ncbi:MAG: GntR family transcriptional regulator [Clostridia bacterium]|nr:GntR family transcriptional regulator [Clostridia bacterium]
MIPINPKSGIPLWEQIRDGLKNQIMLGVWSPGEQLPSVRSLATDLGINPNTIARAFSELEREGLCYSVAGRGCFVEDNLEVIKMKRKNEALERLDEILKELKNADVPKETVISKIEELYKEGEN